MALVPLVTEVCRGVEVTYADDLGPSFAGLAPAGAPGAPLTAAFVGGQPTMRASCPTRAFSEHVPCGVVLSQPVEEVGWSVGENPLKLAIT